MSEVTPTRSVVLELRNEQRAMREGYVFLDEKCLLLAAEIVAELDRYAALARAVRQASEEATWALVAAVARHGLDGLQLYPAGDLGEARLEQRQRSLMGVRLVDAAFVAPLASRPPAIDASPEAERCRIACLALVDRATALAAVTGNLERLSFEYQRSLRRARALADVLLPELTRVAVELETRLEELEQEDAIWMSRAAGSR
ncbi:MAG TPA: V-type ATP synthase subunit D [Casimicrobiaceae bacterium]|nr:V-type ATP synthase subunit D [Casimicrobiaceae bacterium]